MEKNTKEMIRLNSQKNKNYSIYHHKSKIIKIKMLKKEEVYKKPKKALKK